MTLHLGELHEDSDKPEAMVFDITDDEVKRFKVGQMVTITIKGSVGLLQVPPDGSSKEFPAEMGVRMVEKKIVGSNVFADLAEDSDDDNAHEG